MKLPRWKLILILAAQTPHQGCRATAVALHLCSICGLVWSKFIPPKTLVDPHNVMQNYPAELTPKKSFGVKTYPSNKSPRA